MINKRQKTQILKLKTTKNTKKPQKTRKNKNKPSKFKYQNQKEEERKKRKRKKEWSSAVSGALCMGVRSAQLCSTTPTLTSYYVHNGDVTT